MMFCGFKMFHYKLFSLDLFVVERQESLLSKELRSEILLEICKLLTHISLPPFLWDIDKHCRPGSPL